MHHHHFACPASKYRTRKMPVLPQKETGFGLKWSEREVKLTTAGLMELCWKGHSVIKDFADVTLIGNDGSSVDAHKLVLMMCSSYFRKLFKTVEDQQKLKQGGNGHTILVLGNARSDAIRCLLEFLYTGQVMLHSKWEEDELEKIAKDYGISGISYRNEMSQTSEPNQQVDTTVAGQNVGVSAVVAENVKHQEIDLGGPSPKLTTEWFEADNGSENSSGSDDEVNTTRHPMEESKSKIKSGGASRRPPRVSYSTGPLPKGWSKVDPLPKEVLRQGWRKKDTFDLTINLSQMFYCAAGKQRCPAALQIQTLNDGTSVYFRNSSDHANHPVSGEVFGLTEAQSQFVLQCVKTGITQPSVILGQFDGVGRKDKPSKARLIHFLQCYRRDHPNSFGTQSTPKTP